MEELRFVEKPDSISWDDIHNLLMEAHKRNFEKGIVLQYALMQGDEIKNLLGEEGRCWVAMDGNKLVGTTSVTFFIGKDWWNKGKKSAHGCFTGILKNYQGLGILDDMNALKFEYISRSNAGLVVGDTAEDNHMMRKIAGRNGYKTVAFFAPKSDHYSVKIVKWLGECPFTDKYINRRCKISEKLTKWQYKPGKIERSRLISFLCRRVNNLVKKYYGDK